MQYRRRGLVSGSRTTARELVAGDVVNIPPETKHWHGAAKDSWFAHVAVEVPAEDASNEWLEPVSDKDFSGSAEILCILMSAVYMGRRIMNLAPALGLDSTVISPLWLSVIMK